MFDRGATPPDRMPRPPGLSRRAARTSYSRHAWSRVLSRLSLTPSEVAALLDYDLAVSVGVRGRKVHRLFFSPPDEQCFVAIQDQHMGVVVTVLPLDFHESCAWAVSRDTQDHAESLIRNRPDSSREEAAPRDGTAPSVLRAGCYFTSGQGGLRYQNLGSVSAEVCDHDVALLLEDDAVLDDLRQRIHTRCRLGEVLVEVFVRLGKNGSVTRISVDRQRSSVADEQPYRLRIDARRNTRTLSAAV